MTNQRIKKIITLIQNTVNEIQILKSQQKNGLNLKYKNYNICSGNDNVNIEALNNCKNWNELFTLIHKPLSPLIYKFENMEIESLVNFDFYKQDCIDFYFYFNINKKISKLKIKINNWVQTLQKYVYQKLKEQPDYTDAYQTSITKFGYTKVVHVTIGYRDCIWIPKTCTFSVD